MLYIFRDKTRAEGRKKVTGLILLLSYLNYSSPVGLVVCLVNKGFEFKVKHRKIAIFFFFINYINWGFENKKLHWRDFQRLRE